MSISLPSSLLSHMPENRREEFLSEAYVRAIAARAGVNIHEVKADFGIDIGFTRTYHHTRGFTDMSCLPFYCQLKASTHGLIIR